MPRFRTFAAWRIGRFTQYCEFFGSGVNLRVRKVVFAVFCRALTQFARKATSVSAYDITASSLRDVFRPYFGFFAARVCRGLYMRLSGLFRRERRAAHKNTAEKRRGDRNTRKTGHKIVTHTRKVERTHSGRSDACKPRIMFQNGIFRHLSGAIVAVYSRGHGFYIFCCASNGAVV